MNGNPSNITSLLFTDAKTLGISWLNNEVVVSWGDIFTSGQCLYYEISAGSYEAGVNILQWQFTNQTSITFGIPVSVKADSGLDVYVYIRAISTGGFYGQKGGHFKIP